jgi:hypothetical protein
MGGGRTNNGGRKVFDVWYVSVSGECIGCAKSSPPPNKMLPAEYKREVNLQGPGSGKLPEWLNTLSGDDNGGCVNAKMLTGKSFRCNHTAIGQNKPLLVGTQSVIVALLSALFNLLKLKTNDQGFAITRDAAGSSPPTFSWHAALGIRPTLNHKRYSALSVRQSHSISKNNCLQSTSTPKGMRSRSNPANRGAFHAISPSIKYVGVQGPRNEARC